MSKKEIALFDFDGTITTGDSFLAFLKYHFGVFSFSCKLVPLIPAVVSYFMGWKTDEELKTLFCRKFFKNRSVEDMNLSAESFMQNVLTKMLRSRALEEIERHKSMGSTIVIVSASFSLWLKHFAREHGADLISTEMEEKGGVFTGELLTKNCKGPEKVRRISEKFDLSDYSAVYAYGDTDGDREMLEQADKDKCFYRFFHD